MSYEPKFARYSDTLEKGLTVADLLAIQAEDGTLWAHAEDSGCESCYCEVARWNHETERYERFAFCKCMDYRFDELQDVSDEATATEAARRINEPLWFDGRAPIVHKLPDWGGQ